MTNQEFIQTCAAEYGKNNAEWISRYIRYGNDGLRDIYNYKDWPFAYDLENTFNTVDGTEEYTLTETNIKKLITVRITTVGYESRLRPYPYDDFRSAYPLVSGVVTNSTPTDYYATGRTSTNQIKIKLFPIPDRVYQITYDYYADITEIADNTNDLLLPTEAFQPILVDYVLWKSHSHDREFNSAREYERFFKEGLSSLAGNIQLNESGTLPRLDYGSGVNEN